MARSAAARAKKPARKSTRAPRKPSDDRGKRRPFATSMSMSPGRSSGSLKVAYTTSASSSQRVIRKVSVRIAGIPLQHENTSLGDLSLMMTRIPDWSQQGIALQTVTYPPTYPGALVQDPLPGRPTLYELQVEQGPGNANVVDEVTILRLKLST